MYMAYSIKDICWLMNKTLLTQKKLGEVSGVSDALVSRRLKEDDCPENYRYRLLWSYILDEYIKNEAVYRLSIDDAKLVCEKIHDGSKTIADYWRARGRNMA